MAQLLACVKIRQRRQSRRTHADFAEAKEMKISSPHYFEMKRKIERLKAKPLDAGADDTRAKLLRSITDGGIFKAITLKNEAIYRARWNEHGRLFQNVSELVYPPAVCASKGRFNEKGESIFYGATSELGTIIELRPDLGKLFTISRFSRKTNEDPFFFPLAIRDKAGRADFTPRKKSQKLLHDFLYEVLTARGNDTNAYDLSIMLARQFFGLGLDMPQGRRYAGIAYASVEARFIASHLTYNVAMLPSFFHQYYQLAETLVYGLTLEETHYQLNPVNHATADATGVLNWRFSYDEMVARLASGILLDDDICLGMTVAVA